MMEITVFFWWKNFGGRIECTLWEDEGGNMVGGVQLYPMAQKVFQ